MELLDLLEQRVGALLDEVALLREENRLLREDVAVAQHRLEEISALQEELAREKQVREQALTRVDALLSRIQLSLGDGTEDNPFSEVAPKGPTGGFLTPDSPFDEFSNGVEDDRTTA